MNIAGSETETSTNARDLVVTLDRYLTMSTHVDNLCKYASYTLKSIGTIRQCQSVSIKYGKNDTRLCSSYSVIVRVSVVPKRTVVGD